jgi:hypothetical protein
MGPSYSFRTEPPWDHKSLSMDVDRVYYSEIWHNQIWNKPESCINQTITKVPIHKIFANLTCINPTTIGILMNKNYFSVFVWNNFTG